MTVSRRLAADFATVQVQDESDILVLVASSDLAASARLRGWLEADGYLVINVHTGLEALERARIDQPHLVILDEVLCMAGGISVIERVKEAAAPGFLPVIVMVADGVESLVDGDSCLADAAVAKPVSAPTLIVQARAMLRIRWQFDDLVTENRALMVASQAVEMLKRDIIRNVSHELSTPLVQIKAAVSLLIEDLALYDGSAQVRVGDMATEAVARLESAVENIRQLAQSHDIASGPVIVREAAGLALRHLERSWASRGARERVQVQIPNDLPLALADKRALARLLQLLLDNALKFSDDHKPVHVIAAPYQSGYVWVGVQDFGIGIAEEEHERIFDAFYQVDGSSTRRYGGTGTGLALAMLLAKSMRTAIQVESAPGKGSTFSFLLPVADLDALA